MRSNATLLLICLLVILSILSQRVSAATIQQVPKDTCYGTRSSNTLPTLPLL